MLVLAPSSVLERLGREAVRLSPARAIRYVRRRILRPDVVRLHGVVLALPPELPIDVRHGIYSERYESGEARCVLRRLEVGDRVVEMGTGLGYLAVLCAKRLGSSAVSTFEANAALLPTIRRNFELNEVSPSCRHALLGLGRGVCRFHPNEAFFSSSTRRRPGSRETVEVPQLDVNEVIRDATANCIVMDIEGAESELIPAIDWRAIDKLIVELHPAVTGRSAVVHLATHLEAQGLRLDRAVSSQRKRYYERP